MPTTIRLALCENRHDVPGDPRAIYPAIIDFEDRAGINLQADLWACKLKLDNSNLDLYVTGVQYPLVAVINACLKRGVKLTLFHHSPDGSWYPQEIYREGRETE